MISVGGRVEGGLGLLRDLPRRKPMAPTRTANETKVAIRGGENLGGSGGTEEIPSGFRGISGEGCVEIFACFIKIR